MVRNAQTVGTGAVDRPALANKLAHIRGIDLAYEIEGTGPDLVWGHGLTSSRESENQLPLLNWLELPARVLRYDARGHGLSGSTADLANYSWEALARDQLSLADELGIERYVAAGASMGCGTALHAAIMAPDRITALVLVIPPTAWETRSTQAGQWSLAAEVVEGSGVEPIIAASADIAPPDPFVGDPDYRIRRETNLRSWDNARLAQVLRGATQADLPARSAIASITVNTLILAWSGDATHPESTAHELNELIDGSELDVASTADDLDAWTGLVATFLAQ
jgi:3-oxoadipate enol-lactonase